MTIGHEDMRAEAIIEGLLEYVVEFDYTDNPRATSLCVAGCSKSPPDPIGHTKECKLARLISDARDFVKARS